MWFKLAGATFTNNLGTMDSISKSYMMDYSGLTGLSASPGSVSYASDSTPDAKITFTVKSGYVFKSGSKVTASGGASKTYTASADIAAGNSFTMDLTGISGKVTFVGAAELVSSGGNTGGGEPETPVNYTFTINPTPTSATVTLSATGYSTVSGTGSKSITVANGTKVNWTVSASGYTTRTGNWTISGGNKTENITLTTTGGEAADTATLTVNPTPSDAKVTLYAKGYSQSGHSITVSNDGTVNPLYQVSKDNYLSQGGTVAAIKSSQVLDITLQPFSAGNWTDISSTAEKVADYFVIDASGKFNGPYNNWCHWILPATPGKKYRITATAGQSARLWGFYTDKPVSDGSVKPISVSSNNGMATKIADEVIAPEGTVYLVVNNRTNSSDTKAIIEVLD